MGRCLLLKRASGMWDQRPCQLYCVEIGFGNGHFAAWCNNQNITSSGLEIIEQLVSEGKSLGFNVDMSAGNLNLTLTPLILLSLLIYLSILHGVSSKSNWI